MSPLGVGLWFVSGILGACLIFGLCEANPKMKRFEPCDILLAVFGPLLLGAALVIAIEKSVTKGRVG